MLLVRRRVQDDKQCGMILEVIKNDALRQMEKERLGTVRLCMSGCVHLSTVCVR